MEFEIIPFILNTFDAFANACSGIIEFLTKEFNILGQSFTIFEMIFGSGIIIILGYWIVKYLIP